MLVLMTLLAVWCAYSMNWIRQRRKLIESGVVEPYELRKDKGATRRAPGLLFLLGEPGYMHMMADVPDGSAEMDRIRGLFPEAKCNGIMTQSGSPL